MAVKFCKKCGEMRWPIFFHRVHRFHRISYINLPQNLMRWVFVRNAVNFCEKCGEILILPHSPQSPHFLQQFTAFTAFPKSLSTEFSLYLSYFKNLSKNLDPSSTIIRGVNKSKNIQKMFHLKSYNSTNIRFRIE